jgi:hypothetical protein
MSKFGKIRNIYGKTSTQRAENIFPKYLLYIVHEIARKYLRQKKRFSSFSDSEVQKTLTWVVAFDAWERIPFNSGPMVQVICPILHNINTSPLLAHP